MRGRGWRRAQGSPRRSRRFSWLKLRGGKKKSRALPGTPRLVNAAWISTLASRRPRVALRWSGLTRETQGAEVLDPQRLAAGYALGNDPGVVRNHEEARDQSRV